MNLFLCHGAGRIRRRTDAGRDTGRALAGAVVTACFQSNFELIDISCQKSALPIPLSNFSATGSRCATADTGCEGRPPRASDGDMNVRAANMCRPSIHATLLAVPVVKDVFDGRIN